MPLNDDSIIQSLIDCPKIIIKSFNKELGESDRYKRQDIELVSEDRKERFHVFIRKSLELVDDFSIGLQHISIMDSERTVILRCNGRHCPPDSANAAKPHHSEFHIHTGKAGNIAVGLRAEAGAEITRSYASFDGALVFFARTCNIIGAERYFPGLPSPLPPGQASLFEERDEN
jgi:hypothetical protein